MQAAAATKTTQPDAAQFEKARAYAQTVVDGLNESITQFHAVHHCRQRLADAGFTEIREM